MRSLIASHAPLASHNQGAPATERRCVQQIVIGSTELFAAAAFLTLQEQMLRNSFEESSRVRLCRPITFPISCRNEKKAAPAGMPRGDGSRALGDFRHDATRAASRRCCCQEHPAGAVRRTCQRNLALSAEPRSSRARLILSALATRAEVWRKRGDVRRRRMARRGPRLAGRDESRGEQGVGWRSIGAFARSSAAGDTATGGGPQRGRTGP